MSKSKTVLEVIVVGLDGHWEMKMISTSFSLSFNQNVPSDKVMCVDSLKDADLRKDVPLGGLDDE